MSTDMQTDKVILLVEDNPDDQALLLRAMKKNRLANEIVVANDGAEALDYFFGRGAFEGRDLSIQPELVLLDLKLPKVSGHEVLQAMRDDPRTKYVPVVVLTSSVEDADMLKSYDLGANSFVQKPIDFEEFVEAAAKLGLYWLILNRPVNNR
jgi:two-component system response regulator